MADSAEICSHCSKQGAGFQRCSRCKRAFYCGAECQNANWKRHKKTCGAPLRDVWRNVQTASAAEDWRGVLKWEGRMEELMEGLTDALCDSILHAFMKAHMQQIPVKGPLAAVPEVLRLEDRRIKLLGNMQHFRSQGEAMCNSAHMLVLADQQQEAGRMFQRARDVGAAHGFFTVESQACEGLAELSIAAGRHEEGLELLQNALAGLSTLYPLPSTLYPLPSTLYFVPSSLYSLPSTLCPLPVSLYPLPSYLYLPSTLYPPTSTLYLEA